MRAVGVKLDLVIADIAYPAKKILKIGLKDRLAAADADAVKYTLALFEMGKNFINRVSFRASRIKNEPRIVAEGTAQVASARKDGASRESGVVKKCEFIKALNVHLLPSK